MSTIPPHNTEAERSVLGSILIDKEAIVEVADFLGPDDFYHNAHKRILEAIIELYRERSPIDLLTLSEHLHKKNILQAVGGAAYLSKITNAVYSSSHIKKYAEIVKEKSRRRRSKLILKQLEESLADESLDAKQVIENTVSDLVSIVEDKKYNTGKARDILGELVDDWALVNKKGFGLPTGIEALNRSVRGYREGHYWLLMADTNIGKTAFAIMMLHHFYIENPQECVVFFSSEMTHKEMLEKVVAKTVDIEVYDLPGMMETEKVMKAIDEVSKRDLFIFDDCRKVQDMKLKIEYLKLRGYKPRMVFVDYIQNLDGPGSGDTEKLGRISMDLQALAIKQKFCLVVMSQIPKAEKDVHPYAVHPKGCSLIKDHAGVVLFIQRNVKEEDQRERDQKHKVHCANVAMTKNRYGEREFFVSYIDKATGHYYPKKPKDIMIAGSMETSRTFEEPNFDDWEGFI